MEPDNLLELLIKIKDDVSGIKEDQGIIKKDLAHHIKRTELAETRIEKIHTEQKPLIILADRVKFVFLALTFLTGLAGFIISIYH